MRLRNFALMLFVLCLCLSGWSGYKLFRMTQIRGWSPGTRTVAYTVRQKYVQPSLRLSRSDAYLVSWSNTEHVKTPGNHRINVPKEQYNKYYIGAPIEIVYLGNSETPYLKDGIYASNGNFGFDGGCLVVLLIGAILFGYYYVTERDEIIVR